MSLNGLLYWPASLTGQSDPAGRPDLTAMVHVAATAAAPVRVAIADSVDRLIMDSPDFVVVSDAHLDEAVVDRVRSARTIRWIQLSSSGAERAVAAGLPSEMVVTNAAPVWAPAVADHAVALLLGLVRQIPRLTRFQSRRIWSAIDAGRGARALGDMIAVILGCGAVGSEIAVRMAAFGVRTIGVSRRGTSRTGAAFTSYEPMAGLARALAESDVLFVCLPLRDETRRLIGSHEINLLGPGGYLINVARGGVVDSAALDQAVERGSLAGVGLDVTDPEPLPPDSPLWDSDRVIISPHLATMPASEVAGRALGALIRENSQRLLDGRDLLCRVS